MRGAFFALLYHWVMQRTISRKSDPVHFFWAAPMGQIPMPPPGDNRRPLQPSGEDCFRRGRPPGQPAVSRCTSCPSFVGWGDPAAVPKISALPYGGRWKFCPLPLAHLAASSTGGAQFAPHIGPLAPARKPFAGRGALTLPPDKKQTQPHGCVCLILHISLPYSVTKGSRAI